jgi:hypothetical protein
MGKRVLVCAHFRTLEDPAKRPLQSGAACPGHRGPRRRAGCKLRHPRARRRIGVEIIVHTLMDGGGELGLVRLRPQPLLFLRIRYIGRLHQHRRYIRRFEHHEARLLHLRLAHFTDPVQLPQHALRRHLAGAQRGGLRQIQQHRGEHVVLVVERHAADQIGCVFTLGQPARRLVGRAPLRQYVHRRTVDAAVANRVRVDGNEQVRLLYARAPHPIAQRHEVVAVAGQHRLHARFRIDLERELAGDGEHHVLFAGAVLPDGAGVFAAVAGVDGDDEVARIGRRMLSFDRHIDTLTHPKVDDQSIAVAFIGRREEALCLNGPREVEHDAQFARGPARHAHLFYGARAGECGAHAATEPRSGNVEHHPVGIPQYLQAVLGAARQVEYHPGAIGAGPQSNGPHIDGVRRQP